MEAAQIMHIYPLPKKTYDLKQEFSIEKDKYEKYEASVDLTADE